MQFGDILISILTFLAGGGLVHLFTVREAKKKAKAETHQVEEEAKTINISNTNQLIQVYKSTLDDFKKYYEDKEALLTQANVTLKNRVDELTLQVGALKKSNEELLSKLQAAESTIEKFSKLLLDMNGQLS